MMNFKGMDYKKKYEEALERARQSLTYPNMPGFMRVDVTFPELKESEDEKIRKEIIEFIKSRLAGFPDCKRFTDWLEKQKPVEWSKKEKARIDRIINVLDWAEIGEFWYETSIIYSSYMA